MITDTKVKEFVKKGCSAPDVKQCIPPKVLDPTVDPTVKTPPVVNDTSTSKADGVPTKTTTEKDDDVDSDNGDGDNDAVIIAIVVVFLILLIILAVVFFITWYLKRNKGVYQTHEGSAENIHGDTDNLTLVSKPSDQEQDGDKGKEYYL